jgi:tetratricopeptide (TPR) repeat protein
VGDQGDLVTANKLSERAVAIYRETGDRINLSGALNNRAAALVSAGDLIDSRPLFEESLAIAREIGSETGIATALVNLGDVRLALGDLEGSRKAYQEALALFEKNNEKSKVAYPLVGLGDVASATGDLAAATQYYQRGLSAARNTGEKHETAVALSGLGVVQMRQANFAVARGSFDEALALRKELGEESAEGDSHLQLAELAMCENRPSDAEVILRDLVPAPKLPDFESSVRAALAEVLLANGKIAEAQKQVHLAQRALRKNGPVTVRLGVQLAGARVLAAMKRPADLGASRRELNAVLAEAQRIGFVEPELQARLTLGELDAEQGKGTESLQRLRNDAQTKGYLTIAQRAGRGLSPGP